MRKKAQIFAKLISRVPFVRKISLTGSLAEGRAHAGSDIDFFVQTARNRLYLTRFLVTALVHITGERRYGNHVAGAICLNWFAAFDGPARQRQRHVVLWQKKGERDRLLEKILRSALGDFLERYAKSIQQARFTRDPRTHLPGSMVRFSDEELGFHPPKTHSPS
ncbi:nucleotidyltransferase domain-containing protein [Candidatus Berkelbacteria bacterium]|nr:nucleotidyltransferase domain-containing protein [Candidatus Berkelbacteria bacterium]